MELKHIINNVIVPGLRLLPEKMDTPEARAMMLAIGLQESRFMYRKQIGGPARGFWQFEKGGGVRGVLRHQSTKRIIQDVIFKLGISADDCYNCLETDDQLAAVFARLLLYTDSRPLPSLSCAPDESWNYYINNWRPGKPHRKTWDEFWQASVETVSNARSA